MLWKYGLSQSFFLHLKKFGTNFGQKGIFFMLSLWLGATFMCHFSQNVTNICNMGIMLQMCCNKMSQNDITFKGHSIV